MSDKCAKCKSRGQSVDFCINTAWMCDQVESWITQELWKQLQEAKSSQRTPTKAKPARRAAKS